jgi:DNA repair photolyase
MKIKEIKAKTLLANVRDDDWFGLRYNMNLYRGCEHGCIYCDSRSECYGLDHFGREVWVKVNALALLEDELSRKRERGTVGTGSMNDPYTPSAERAYRLTGRALELLAAFRFPVHLITKSSMVLDDLETLRAIHAETLAVVSFTITAADDDLARKIEPGAPPPSARFDTMAKLAGAGIATGLTMMPVLPFIADNAANVTAIIERAADAGASYVLPWFGMTLRDRQRAYFYRALDRLFPGVRAEYERAFGGSYSANSPRAASLYALAGELCGRYGLVQEVPRWPPPPDYEQLSLF